MPPDKAVKPGVRFVKHADTDAVGTIPPVFNPELKAFFWVNVPLVYPGVVGQGWTFGSRLFKADGLSRAGLSTLPTDPTHLADAYVNGPVGNQGQIG